jgi:hypothetical protein
MKDADWSKYVEEVRLLQPTCWGRFALGEFEGKVFETDTGRWGWSIARDSVAVASGEAFRDSGRAFDDMRRHLEAMQSGQGE